MLHNFMLFAIIPIDASLKLLKQYGYKNIKTIAEFKSQVPIQNYESLLPFIERMLKGEQRVLWPTKIEWFAKSSGTTSERSKFIPVSYEAISYCHMKGGQQIMVLYCHHNPNSNVYDGKCLVIGGSNSIGEHNSQIRYGDLSAVLMKNMMRVGRLFKAPEEELMLMPDWNNKIELMAERCANENITHIAGVPTWNIVLIKRILERTGAKNILEVWPNLQLYLHGGVSFTPYETQFKQLIPSDRVQYWQTYNASEGFFGIQENPYRKDMLLLLDHGVFYEFMPLGELDKEKPHTLQLHEVEVNVNYALVISTNAGLWRYLIGDTIKFTTLKPYRIQVTGRTKHFINAFGEELIVDNSDAAIAEAAKITGAKVNEYTAAPIYFSTNNNGGHEWLIEFDVPPNSLSYFIECLDNALQKHNSDYAAKRFNNMAMKLPLVQIVTVGTFHKWLAYKGKLGGQHKVPRLANHRQYIDEIKALVNTQNKENN